MLRHKTIPALFFGIFLVTQAHAQATINGVPSQIINPSIPPQKSDVYTATNGFNYTIPNGITIEVINGTSLLATGSITLPSSPSDGMPLTIESPKGVTLITISTNSGQSLAPGYSMPVTLSALNPVRMKYSSVNSTWYPN